MSVIKAKSETVEDSSLKRESITIRQPTKMTIDRETVLHALEGSDKDYQCNLQPYETICLTINTRRPWYYLTCLDDLGQLLHYARGFSAQGKSLRIIVQNMADVPRNFTITVQ